MPKQVKKDGDVLYNQVIALCWNIYSWAVSSLIPAKFRSTKEQPKTKDICVVIRGPGGFDRLELIDIPGALIDNDGAMTVGYNVEKFPPPFVHASDVRKHGNGLGLVIVRNKYFSVNYADIAIRWGLYESALRYVGWPIVPGFDVAGVVEWASPETGFHSGDEVFGFTLFGAYSSRILVPAEQLRVLPRTIKLEEGAAIPAVCGTALHSVSLAGGFPRPPSTKNHAALIHSAAGGVGSMLLQICKICGFDPIVAVVGSSHKISACVELGADVVIDKSKEKLTERLTSASPDGFVAVFDANGVETLQDSYNRLARCGRLIVYGFHTNLPKASGLLSPFRWISMALKLFLTPKFDPMWMVLDSKAVFGFNLSFFADEKKLVAEYMGQITEWLSERKISPPKITILAMKEIGEAHRLIQSGTSIGKIVMRVP